MTLSSVVLHTAGKTLAPALVVSGHKTALVKHSSNMIGDTYNNFAYIAAKTMVLIPLMPGLKEAGFSTRR
ncbi:hypothetical protein H6F90_11320 [Trichocoleus sp. FACHB-591]|uniref:hypothetical protein n=1 Tax=Trichocoleus sp. FACHB-591 TaxID=2692872 RepID=UPI001681F262|nr:hypothetical protein [Trichocoleus sp. FACHB-591]MBD2095743.1 hypothetical protein [Trichocoleus sp. FACHB-591]